MCGIAGIIDFFHPVDKKELEHMTDRLAHRGPDDAGTWVSQNKNVGLGHRRLSILDLSPAGHQPMISHCGTYVLVFNGEIYNFQEIRTELKKLGRTFRSHTDSEVILEGYAEWKETILEKLQGMFSFALFDKNTQELFCARDRLGKKPFKYRWDGNSFLFASEIKAILALKKVQKKTDFKAIHHYLAFQYVPAPLTGFEGIQKLPPAHFLKIHLPSKTIHLQRYWQLNYSKKSSCSLKEWKEELLRRFEESVRLRMISDVPLGAFLSGGIDSSAVVAMMAKHSTDPIKTFSIGFAEDSYNELDYARTVATQFQTNHHEEIVKPDALSLLPKLVSSYEEPYADPSALATWVLAEMTKKHVTVALNGDGGDENFAGYTRYSFFQFSQKYDQIPSWIRQTLKKGTQMCEKMIPLLFFHRARRFAQHSFSTPAERYMNYIAFFLDEQKQDAYTPEFLETMKGDPSVNLFQDSFIKSRTQGADFLEQSLFCDIEHYLPEDLLVKVDIATMAHSLESRSPFLDHHFLEWTATIPSELKLKGANQKKWILKQALEGILPPEILYRKKMGFGVPLEHWFRNELRDLCRDTLLSKQAKARGIFRPEWVEKILTQHQNTSMNYSNHIWAMLTLEQWFLIFFDA